MCVLCLDITAWQQMPHGSHSAQEHGMRLILGNIKDISLHTMQNEWQSWGSTRDPTGWGGHSPPKMPLIGQNTTHVKTPIQRVCQSTFMLHIHSDTCQNHVCHRKYAHKQFSEQYMTYVQNDPLTFWVSWVEPKTWDVHAVHQHESGTTSMTTPNLSLPKRFGYQIRCRD
jgi:hypothetical protein